MRENFKKCLEKVLKHEGGYVDHPKDPGGATNKGITLKTYQRMFGKEKTKEDLRIISDVDVELIYDCYYWHKCRCDDLPPGIDYAVFDAAVNSGVSRSAKWLQECLECQTDGIIGNKTIHAAVNDICHADLIKDICSERLAFLCSLRTWSIFGNGWGRRVEQVERDAIAMVKEVKR